MSVFTEEIDTSALDSLLDKVYRDGGYDFREYKLGPITRRLKRRLHATGTRTYRSYMRFLDCHPEEYEQLVEALSVPGLEHARKQQEAQMGSAKRQDDQEYRGPVPTPFTCGQS